MIRSGFKSKLPPQRPCTQWTGSTLPGPRSAPVRVADGADRAIVQVPKGPKAKPGKRTPTKLEAEWMAAIVAYGCVACRIDFNLYVKPAVHHILRGGVRMGHLFTLPLCDPGHHQNGDRFGMVSRHPWKARFEKRYGSEMELLGRLKRELGYFDDWKVA